MDNIPNKERPDYSQLMKLLIIGIVIFGIYYLGQRLLS